MERIAKSTQSVFFVGLLLVLFVVSVWPANAIAIVAHIKHAFVTGYTVAYFDRATWITGCF